MIADLLNPLFRNTPVILVVLAVLVIINAIANSAALVPELYYAGWMLAAAAALHHWQKLTDRPQ